VQRVIRDHLTLCILGTGSAASPVPEEDAEKLSVMQ